MHGIWHYHAATHTGGTYKPKPLKRLPHQKEYDQLDHCEYYYHMAEMAIKDLNSESSTEYKEAATYMNAHNCQQLIKKLDSKSNALPLSDFTDGVGGGSGGSGGSGSGNHKKKPPKNPDDGDEGGAVFVYILIAGVAFLGFMWYKGKF